MAFSFNQHISDNSRESRSYKEEDSILGTGEVQVSSAGAYGVQYGQIQIDLTIHAYSGGDFIGYHDISLEADLGGPGASGRKYRPPSAGVFSFTTLLKGPAIQSGHEAVNALDGAPVSLSGYTAAFGIGASFGSFTVGDYYDPSSSITVYGFGSGLSHLGGYARVIDYSFRPRHHRK